MLTCQKSFKISNLDIKCINMYTFGLFETILKLFLVLLEILNTLSTKTFQVYSVISETCIIN